MRKVSDKEKFKNDERVLHVGKLTWKLKTHTHTDTPLPTWRRFLQTPGTGGSRGPADRSWSVS